MQNILAKIPKSVIKVLEILRFNGYEAYIVGGAVRDILLGRKIQDFDISTSALPEEIRKIFLKENYKVIETGIKHGTVTVSINNTSYEITTFRKDGKYLDNRHPSDVCFDATLEEDLNRRDFTINALALDINGKIIDYHNGTKDLYKKIIRTVGDANQRFNEDALRMLRAVRFMAVLKFQIEEETKNAIIQNASLIKNVSIERINSEMEKILNNCINADVKAFEPLFKAAYNYDLDITKDEYEVIKRFPDYVMKIAYLFSKLEKEDAVNHLNSLKISNERKDLIQELLNSTYENVVLDDYKIKKYLSVYGYEKGFYVIQYLCYLNNSDILIMKDKCEALLEKVVNLKNLDLNGEDLIDLGYSGVSIGNILNALVELVLRGDVKNEKKALIKAIKKVI